MIRDTANSLPLLLVVHTACQMECSLKTIKASWKNPKPVIISPSSGLMSWQKAAVSFCSSSKTVAPGTSLTLFGKGAVVVDSTLSVIVKMSGDAILEKNKR